MCRQEFDDQPFFSRRTSKRRKGFPSETKVKRGVRIVRQKQAARRKAWPQRFVSLR